ncbi:Aste57867_1877 [Aphanomyces stellatus]|uniref:Aste57867_1877 protein n=1 Tax=Aphanomyces stellatus TaxID=120398 RepID=A0A485K7H0_9STRA|nr:hypothetical protein As57867_001875 [Aphanomyces stellatus]VFT79084.1 Aste57867_1877 [Aphanomyces stellatus]
MVILTHDELNTVIWGGGGSVKAPLEPVLEQHVRSLQRIWCARVAATALRAFVEDSWSSNPTKATAVLLLLYAICFFLLMRGQQALTSRLLVLLGLVGFISDVGRPLMQWTTQPLVPLLALVLQVTSFLLALAMLWSTGHILVRLVHTARRAPRSSTRQKKHM